MKNELIPTILISMDSRISFYLNLNKTVQTVFLDIFVGSKQFYLSIGNAVCFLKKNQVH